MNWKNMKSELSNVLDNNKDIFIKKRKNLKAKLFFATIAIIYLCALFVSVPNNVSADTVTDTITGATPEEAFKNLQNKIDNKTINGDRKYELTLETDVNVNPTSSTAPIRLNGSRRTGKVEYIIDLNGHNINYVEESDLNYGIFQIANNASNVSLTIKDSTVSEGQAPEHGIFNNTTNNCRAVDALSMIGGEVNIENIRVENFINGVGGSMRIIAQTSNNPVSVNIKNSIFRNNNSNYGGGAIVLNKTNATLEGNLIEGNSTSANNNPRSGGGISAEYSNITLTNNVISGNTANNGGGLYISVDGKSNVRDYTIKLSGNKINNNSAIVNSANSGGLGGGVDFSLSGNVKVNFTIESGEFIGNHAVEGGAIYHGIDWTHKDSNLVLYNALITGNQAVRGAGIWLCPRAKTLMYSTLGGAIYGNTASGQHTTSRQTLDATGDDIRYEGVDGDDEQYSASDRTVLTVSDRTWNGFLVDWYKDEVGKRFSAGNRELADSIYYTNTTNAASLHGEINDAAKSALNEEATLIIKDNVASGRGGGIFSNNVVQIGENEDASLDVTKKFQKDRENYEGETLLPEKVVVDLYRSNRDGSNKVKVEENVELNKDNNWHHTFEDLPSYHGENTEDNRYVYSVEEQDLTNFVKEEHSYDDGSKHYTYTLTNEVFALPVKYKINVKKLISGKIPFKDEEFTFKLSTEETQGVILPDDLTAKVTGAGTTEFKDVTFTKPGTYKFNVVEEKGNNKDYTYDDSAYEVKITISEDSDGEHLKVENVEITKNEKSVDEVVFVNDFNPKDRPVYVDIVSNPKTIDMIAKYVVLFMLSILGTFAIVVREYCFKK